MYILKQPNRAHLCPRAGASGRGPMSGDQMWLHGEAVFRVSKSKNKIEKIIKLNKHTYIRKKKRLPPTPFDSSIF
jgi:hypothetical protein